MLRRERKRRLEAAGRIATPAARISPAARRPRRELIGSYLPAELSEEELQGDRRAGRARERGASRPKDMGIAMKQAMAAVDGRADGKRVSGLVRASLQA